MQNLPKTLTKNQLLQWLNEQTRSQGVYTQRIEHLGNGVGYITLLNQLHPGLISTTSRFIKKPKNEYENITNLKLLATLFMKLGVNKTIDVSKISKMKMQDNLLLLQWLYTYSHNIIKRDQENKSQLGPSRPKKINYKAPVAIRRTTINKFDSQNCGFDDEEFKNVSFFSHKIHEIQTVIQQNQDQNPQTKLNRIKNILGFKSHKKDIESTPACVSEPVQSVNMEKKQTSQKSNISMEEQYKSATRQPIFSFKSQTLEERCQSYLKSSASQRNESCESSFKKKEVGLSVNNLIHQYEHENQPGRLTDTSLLLCSERKSIQSEGNLLNEGQ